MRWTLVGLVVVALVAVGVCVYSPGTPQRLGPLVAFTPTPAEQAAAAPTPEPTPTPPPTKSVPSPTALPILSAATPTPPPSALDLFPRQVRQGRVLLIRVLAPPGLSVQGSVDGDFLTFLPYVQGYWAIFGFPPWATEGIHRVRVMTTDAAGGNVHYADTVEVVSVPLPVDEVVLGSEQSTLLAPITVAREQQQISSVTAGVTVARLWQGQFIGPAGGTVSSFFGARRSYNGGPATGYHEGLDIAGSAGDPVVAANEGVVVLARALTVRGNGILIDHGAGVYSGYYHLAQIKVQEGQPVVKGQLIGEVGATGLATGPHLHWEIIVRGVNVDPMEWLERSIGP